MNDPNTLSPRVDSTDDLYAQKASTVQTDVDKASDAVASVKSGAGEAVDHAKEQASSFVSQVKDKALTAAGEQKDGLADTLDGLAKSVHKTGEQFAGQQDWIAAAIERGATELTSLATSLRDNDLGSLVAQVKSIARRQPAVFIGACLASGFALARLGKLVAADVTSDDLPTMPEVGHGGN